MKVLVTYRFKDSFETVRYGVALTSFTNQRKYLETFLEDGRIPISNNLCEANIKPLASARRAWLFTDTPKGATANAVLYTLVETAKANGLDTCFSKSIKKLPKMIASVL